MATTGELTRGQVMWVGVLHAGPGSALGGLTALEVAHLERWRRPEVTVLVSKSEGLTSCTGVRYVETRRLIDAYRSPNRLPTWRVEPAALLWAAYAPVTRSAYGLLAACVQQRLTTPSELTVWIDRMRPLRRARALRTLLTEIAGGSQSVAEFDVLRMCRRHRLPLPARQVPRRDSSGRLRFTDCEWRLPDGRTAVLEVDGGLHMSVEHWSDDLDRHRGLVVGGAVVLRCTAWQLRHDDAPVARDLRRLGVGSSGSARRG